MTAPLVTARGLGRDYRLPRTRLLGPAPVRHALVDADVVVHDGEIVALIGESGSGKSTLARLLLGLGRPTRGEVWFDGRLVDPRRTGRDRWLRRQTGIVFQDPYSSLDPRQTVGRIVAEPLRALHLPGDHRAQVRDVLDRVGLGHRHADRYPHELSGGQRQRVAIARAIVHGPRLLVGDEPLSALDVTVRAQVLTLLTDLNRERGTAIVLVSHDIGLVQNFAHRVYVLHAGHVVEHGAAEDVLGAPRDDYTRRLVASVPSLPPAP